MKSLRAGAALAAALVVILAAGPVRAEPSFRKVADGVNQKLVKLFGAGGIRGLPAYGTGIVVSPDGYILTVYSHILDTADLRVHAWDGTRYHAKVVAIEPVLDVALVKISSKEKQEPLPYFDVVEAAKRPVAESGTGVLAFSNQFEIATRDEPLSVQRGVVAAYAKLSARIGIFEAVYRGDVYVLDAITNNPGAGGGALTTRKGELLGLIGKELRNELTNTWINYAVPIGAKMEVEQADGKKVTVSILDLVQKKEAYKPIVRKKDTDGGGGYTGILLVTNAVEFTPAYVDEVLPGSPAEKAKLRPDDLIVYVDGRPVNDINTYNELISKYRPGSKVQLEIQRGTKLTTVMLTIEKPPVAPKK